MAAARAAAGASLLVKKLRKHGESGYRVAVGLLPPAQGFMVQAFYFLQISIPLIILLAVLFHFLPEN